MLENRVDCTFIFTFFVWLFLKIFFVNEYELFLNKRIWLIDGTLTSTTVSFLRRPESNSNEEVAHFRKVSGLEPNHQIQFCVIYTNFI